MIRRKFLPQQAEVTQGVPGSLRPRIFLTFRHYKGGSSSDIGTGRLYPRKNPWYSFSEGESSSEHMVLSGEPRKKSPVTLPGIDPGTFRLVAQYLSHYATPGPTNDKEYTNEIRVGDRAWDEKARKFMKLIALSLRKIYMQE